jgi:hypothetical protein
MSDPHDRGQGLRARRHAVASDSAKTERIEPKPGNPDVHTREMQYMLAGRGSAELSLMSGGGNSFDAKRIVDALAALPDIKVVRLIKQNNLTVLSATPSVSNDIVVVRCAVPERAEYLESMARRNPSLIVERDYLLQHLGNFRPQFVGLPRSPSQITTVSIPVRFHVQGDNGRPLQNRCRGRCHHSCDGWFPQSSRGALCKACGRLLGTVRRTARARSECGQHRHATAACYVRPSGISRQPIPWMGPANYGVARARYAAIQRCRSAGSNN